MRALHRLSWAGKQAVDLKPTCESFREFNELLILGYMEEDKIAVSRQAFDMSSTPSANQYGSSIMMTVRRSSAPLLQVCLWGAKRLCTSE